MARTLMLIPCDICNTVPAMYVARCGLLVCKSCWHEEKVQHEEVPEERPSITFHGRRYAVRPEALVALADAEVEVAAGLVSSDDVIIALLAIEGYHNVEAD